MVHCVVISAMSLEALHYHDSNEWNQPTNRCNVTEHIPLSVCVDHLDSLWSHRHRVATGRHSVHGPTTAPGYRWQPAAVRVQSASLRQTDTPSMNTFQHSFPSTPRSACRKPHRVHTAERYNRQTCQLEWTINRIELECGQMPNVMAALANIGGALCSTPQSLADVHCWSAAQ